MIDYLITHWIDLTILLVDAGILGILVVEYYYDKKVFETNRRRYRKKRNRVIVDVIDGQATVTSKPDNIDVVINTEGEV